MKNLLIVLILVCNFSVAQEVKAEFLRKIPLVADVYVGNDSFNNQYYIKDNVFYKKHGITLFQFADFQLGKIEHADILNPLQIILFYKNSNTVVVLDNKLTEIRRLNFNEIEPYRTVGYAGTAGENSLWVFNVDTQRIEFFATNKNRRQNIPRTKPIEGIVLGMESNYNFCWVYLASKLFQFNIYGVKVGELPVAGIEALAQSNGNLVFFKNENYYYLTQNSLIPVKLEVGDLKSKQFHLNNEILYIYGDLFVHEYKINQPKN